MWSGIDVIATDLDGTLLKSDGKISERCAGAMSRAAAASVAVVIVTARPPRVLNQFDLRNVHGLAVCGNGAVIVDLSTGDVLAMRLLPASEVLAIAERIRGLVPDMPFAVETANYYGHEPRYVPEWPAPDGSPVTTLDTLCKPGVFKLLGRHADFTIDRLDEIRDVVGPLATVTCSSDFGMVEIGPAGVSKASALAEVVALLSRSRANVVAIGDMPNDLPMLEWAAVGAAVANAHREVLEAADVVMPANDDDGVAHLIDLVLGAPGSRA